MHIAPPIISEGLIINKCGLTLVTKGKKLSLLGTKVGHFLFLFLPFPKVSTRDVIIL